MKSVLLSLTLFLIPYLQLTSQVSSSGYIRLGADSIYYETRGSGNVIILIHDGLLPSDVWDAQSDYFSKDYRVVRYDRRGYGRSSPSTVQFSHLEDLDALVTQLKIDSACIIGASSGGGLAIDFTLKFPQKVTSLVLVGAVVGGFSYTRHFTTRGGHLPSDIKESQKVMLYFVSEDPYSIYYENTAAKQKAIELAIKYPQRDFAAHKYDLKAVPALRRLNEIKVPALILAGEFDIPDVHAHAGAINAGIRNSRRMVIPRAGHLIHLEQPGIFNEIVADFLK